MPAGNEWESLQQTLGSSLLLLFVEVFFFFFFKKWFYCSCTQRICASRAETVDNSFPVGWEDPPSLRVMRQLANSSLYFSLAEFNIFILPVPLRMLSDSDHFPNQMVAILREIRGKAFGLLSFSRSYCQSQNGPMPLHVSPSGSCLFGRKSGLSCPVCKSVPSDVNFSRVGTLRL